MPKHATVPQIQEARKRISEACAANDHDKFTHTLSQLSGLDDRVTVEKLQGGVNLKLALGDGVWNSDGAMMWKLRGVTIGRTYVLELQEKLIQRMLRHLEDQTRQLDVEHRYRSRQAYLFGEVEAPTSEDQIRICLQWPYKDKDFNKIKESVKALRGSWYDPNTSFWTIPAKLRLDAREIIDRYRFSHQIGFFEKLDELDQVVKRLEDTHYAPSGRAAPRRRIGYNENHRDGVHASPAVILEFPFSQDIRDDLKAEFPSAMWQGHQKHWFIPRQDVDFERLERLAARHHFGVRKDLKQWLARDLVTDRSA